VSAETVNEGTVQFRPLGDLELNLPAAAGGRGKASAPVDERHLGAMAFRHFAGIGLDRSAVLSAPYYPHHSVWPFG
jgi:hypothetical protein